MGYPIYLDTITLTDGTIIRKNKDDVFPPYMEMSDTHEPCHVCPVRPLCDDNNSFDCDTYGMFQGAYFSFDDIIKLCEKVGAK